MTTDDWQTTELARLASALPPGSAVHAYGSAAAGPVDGWSDLDAEISLGVPQVELARIVDVAHWSWRWSSAIGTRGRHTIAADPPVIVARTSCSRPWPTR